MHWQILYRVDQRSNFWLSVRPSKKKTKSLDNQKYWCSCPWTTIKFYLCTCIFIWATKTLDGHCYYSLPNIQQLFGLNFNRLYFYVSTSLTLNLAPHMWQWQTRITIWWWCPYHCHRLLYVQLRGCCWCQNSSNTHSRLWQSGYTGHPSQL